jgi:CRISPR-associated protein Cmr4
VYKEARPIYMTLETPMHAGTGSGLGVIDLPIQRERHTYYPKIEASSIKGVLRAEYKRKFKEQNLEEEGNEILECLFGPEKGELHGSALGFTDAKILLFPVKSMKGVFAWTTCPCVIERFRRELDRCGMKIPETPPECTITSNSDIVVKGKHVILEEYTININDKSDCSELATWLSENIMIAKVNWWRQKLKKSLVILPNDVFEDFVRHSTELITRTQIDSTTGTVKSGHLFSEELLPPDTVMYTLALGAQIFKNPNPFDNDVTKALDKFFEELPEVLQLGGDATLGRGFVRLVGGTQVG